MSATKSHSVIEARSKYKGACLKGSCLVLLLDRPLPRMKRDNDKPANAQEIQENRNGLPSGQ